MRNLVYMDSVDADRATRKRAHFTITKGRVDVQDPTTRDDTVAPNAKTLEQLFARNPFADFDIATVRADLQGWNSYSNVFRDAIEQIRPRRIIEVGVWKGTASIHMAEIVRELGLSCEIICVDTWLGSPEHLLADHSTDRYRSLRFRHGYPQLFYTFLGNVIRSEVTDYIVPLPMASESAAVVLRKLGLMADMVHIDAAHEYEPVLRDLRMYWDLLTDRGVLIGDDYLAKKSVTRAADDFADLVDRPLCGYFPKFVIPRSESVEFSIVNT